MINLLHEIRVLWDMFEMSDLEDDEEDYLCELLDDWDDVQDRRYLIRKKNIAQQMKRLMALTGRELCMIMCMSKMMSFWGNFGQTERVFF